MSDKLPDILGIVRQLESRFIELENITIIEECGIMVFGILILLALAWALYGFLTIMSYLLILIAGGLFVGLLYSAAEFIAEKRKSK